MATPSKSMVGADDALVRSGVRRAGRRLIPLLILLYFVNYLDRVNIAFAGPNGMNDESGSPRPHSASPRACSSSATSCWRCRAT
jgi:hypothetical protein